MKTEELQQLINDCGDNYISLLQQMGVLYIRPKRGVDTIGPLVGRESTYSLKDKPGVKFHYVSENYYNGAVLMQHLLIFEHLAKGIRHQMQVKFAPKDVVFHGLGTRGEYLAKALNALLVSPEADASKLRIALVQDILDPNILEQGIEDLRKQGKKLALVCCVINANQCYDGYLPVNSQGPIVLISLIKELLMMYQQDHPLVVEDIACGNIVWNPKGEWDKLAEVMTKANGVGLPHKTQSWPISSLNIDNTHAKEILVI